ncbi:MAG: hypothetical protein JNK05_40140 [Myxococcales bacterium]|nr:hypothetical protein [Myxococcales bacterium]
MTQNRPSSDEVTPPPSIGNLEQHAPSKILGALGRLRFTGELRFTVGQKTHSVSVLGGTPSDEGDATRAMELFLAAVSGPYELREEVPLLPSAVRNDSHTIEGSLADCAPSELLNFCESIGLTGKLELASGGRECLVRYSKGELESITVDGVDDGALDEVFAWNDGRYKIRQRNAFEEEHSSITDFRAPLGTIEVALSEILKRSNKGQPVKPKPKTIPPSIAPPAANAPSPDQSVRIIFRSPKLERDSKTAHASASASREVVSLDSASSGPLDEAKAEAIVAKAREAERQKEKAAKEAAVAEALEQAPPRADGADSSSAPTKSSDASVESSPAAAPSRPLTMAISLVFALMVVVGLWSLGSMASAAR